MLNLMRYTLLKCMVGGNGNFRMWDALPGPAQTVYRAEVYAVLTAVRHADLEDQGADAVALASVVRLEGMRRRLA